MAYSFGNDEFFLELRNARAAGDRERLAALLYEGLGPVISTRLRMSGYAMFTAEDRQDARQEAVLYILRRIDAFLDDPRNDPDYGGPDRYTEVSRQGWAHKWVGYSLNQTRDRIKKHALSPGAQKGEALSVDSLDRELVDGDGGRVGDFVPSAADEPEARALRLERLAEACRAFFGLKNSPELLTAVGFVILSESLGGEHRSLDAYADLLNGCRVLPVIAAMERLLREHDIDPAALDGLKARLGDDAEDRVIDGLTARTLANRKNSMLSTLRAGLDREKGD